MKKFWQTFLLISCSFVFAVCAFVGAKSAKADVIDTFSYLINPTKLSSYGISADNIYNSSPFDTSTKTFLPGSSIYPTISDKGDYNETFSTEELAFADNQSLFVYIYFSNSYAGDLTITISDGTDSYYWQLYGADLSKNIEPSNDSAHLRYGWIQFQLPKTALNKNAGTINIKSISLQCDNSAHYNDQGTTPYSVNYYYGFYVANSTKEQIEIEKSQNFFTFAVNFNISDTLCVGDSYQAPSFNNLFDYLIIGDTNVKNTPLSEYHYKLIIYTAAGSKLFETAIESGNTSTPFTFNYEGGYMAEVVICNSEGQYVAATNTLFNVREFVAIYLSNDINTMYVGDRYENTINIGSLVTDYNNIVVTSSNSKVATARISGNKLVIEANGAGKTTITISVNATRAGKAEQTYSYTYNLEVQKKQTSPWIVMIISGIGLIIGVIVVYTIMVRRRLIKGKYPKY